MRLGDARQIEGKKANEFFAISIVVNGSELFGTASFAAADKAARKIGADYAASLDLTAYELTPEADAVVRREIASMAPITVKRAVAKASAKLNTGKPSHQVVASNVYDDDDNPTTHYL